LTKFANPMKTMRQTFPPGKKFHVAAPDRKAILAQVELRSGDWKLLRLLALAEPVMPCHHHVD